MSEFLAEAPQATESEGLAQGPCVAARAGFESVTLQTKGDELTNEPPCLTKLKNGMFNSQNCFVNLAIGSPYMPVSEASILGGWGCNDPQILGWGVVKYYYMF